MFDQKDALLMRARGALQRTRDELEKILDADDDAILAQPIIADEGEENMYNGEIQATRTPEEKRRQWVFERVSKLCEGRRSASEGEKFFDSEAQPLAFPADRRRVILKYFVDGRIAEIDHKRAGQLELLVFERCLQAWELADLLEQLYRQERNELRAKIVSMQVNLIQRGVTTYNDLRRKETFAEIAALTGKPIEVVAQVFDRMDWKALRRDRIAAIRQALYPDLPEVNFGRREPRNQDEHLKQQAALRARESAEKIAEEAMRISFVLMHNLRGELGARRLAEIAKRKQAA